ncbi:hypothetical protein BX600DRAFT_504394 [Xylariales sp. PMI_506]|nr:hypothetical protein BX600DRAFT_504394 [Xylariales sp. PMI_506]
MSHSILSADYYLLLETALPRWVKEGLWQETAKPLSSQPTEWSKYAELRLAYRCVCELDVRIGDDAIRNRMALIRLHMEYTKTHSARKRGKHGVQKSSTVGRGDATQIIDNILESIHEGWKELGQKRQSELRAKFHERKKQGKRWCIVANTLGPAILLLCSLKLANMVKNTRVTASMLEAIVKHAQTSQQDSMRTLSIVNPLAMCLFENAGYTQIIGQDILDLIRMSGTEYTSSHSQDGTEHSSAIIFPV